jgi:hypothetical protein
LDGHTQDFVFGADRKSNMVARAYNVFSLVEILKIFLLETTKPIGSYVKIKSSHGGHLEFPISKRFTSLVQDHPMIIPAKPQFIIEPYGSMGFE